MLTRFQKIVSGLGGDEETADEVDLTSLSIKFRYEDLMTATENFSPEARLGSGTSGEVFRGCLHGGTEVAVKVLRHPGAIASFEDEIKVLSRFRHPNLVILLGWGQHGDTGAKFLVYELMPGGNIGRRLYRSRLGKEVFAWQHRLRVACNAACGLSYMVNSEPKAFHRDICVGNILLDSNGIAKMADFGLAGTTRNMCLDVENIGGTPGYVCPEYARTGTVTERSEVYSFGVVLLELLINELPAKRAPSGEIEYPIRQVLQPDVSGAIQRLLSHLDRTASWMLATAKHPSELALRCVDSDLARRPAFAQIANELRLLCQSVLANCPSNSRASALASLSPQKKHGVESVSHGISFESHGPWMAFTKGSSQPICEAPDENMPPRPVDPAPQNSWGLFFEQPNVMVKENSSISDGGLCEKLLMPQVNTVTTYDNYPKSNLLFDIKCGLNDNAKDFGMHDHRHPAHAIQAPRRMSSDEACASFHALRWHGPRLPVCSRSYLLPKGDHPVEFVSATKHSL